MNWPNTVGVALLALGGLTNTCAAAECSDAPVKTLNAGLLAAMTQGNTSTFASRQAALIPVLAEAFDLRVISRLVLGKAYADLDEAQRASFIRRGSEATNRLFTDAQRKKLDLDNAVEREETLRRARQIRVRTTDSAVHNKVRW